MKNKKIAIIGLGYVGLPLAVEFGKKFEVIGFDINKNRIDLLKKNEDQNLEISKKEFLDSIHLNFSNIVDDIKDCNIYIVTVPTPIDNHKKPNLSALKKSSEIIGSVLKKNDIVIYESTVYPGATEEFCAPILEKKSGLKFNIDFYCGYSPERINPGDKKHKLIDIKKITSGSTAEIALVIDDLYKEIIIAGTYKAESIQVAEAAKVIENTQRDLNIALINELAIIFKKMNIDTEAILKAAETKWNFMPFRPGLVGGHCIGVDPYYLTHKANAIGYKPEVILAGRKLNDNMASYVANEVSKLMKKKNIRISKSNILIMGITFKENCPDYRNTQVVDLVKEFKKYSCNVEVHDPWVSHKFIEDEYNISLIDQPIKEKYDAIILAVAHDKFKLLSENLIRSYEKSNLLLYVINYLLKSNKFDGSL
jgi:UDP-N-acetyl-D-glucosamine/UDP-N-acetyl-D-galactosamine dehydrogenase